MQALNIENFGMELLSNSENSAINGGHDGTAYKVGHVVGDIIQFVGTVVGVVTIFFAPKS